MENYRIEVLYDNGISETYETIEIEEENFEEIIEAIQITFTDDVKGSMQIPLKNGEEIIININKVTRVKIL